MTTVLYSTPSRTREFTPQVQETTLLLDTSTGSVTLELLLDSTSIWAEDDEGTMVEDEDSAFALLLGTTFLEDDDLLSFWRLEEPIESTRLLDDVFELVLDPTVPLEAGVTEDEDAFWLSLDPFDATDVALLGTLLLLRTTFLEDDDVFFAVEEEEALMEDDEVVFFEDEETILLLEDSSSGSVGSI